MPLDACSPTPVRTDRQVPHLRLRHVVGGVTPSPAVAGEARKRLKRPDGPGSVTGGVGILGTISSASGKAAGETRITSALQGHPGRRAWSLPALWSYQGARPGQEAGSLATSSEFPRVHLMTPPARARQNDRGIVRLDTFRGRRRRGRLRHRKVGTFRRGGPPHGTGATREVTGLRGS